MSIRRPNMAPHKTPMAQQPVEQRLNNFDEVSLGYTLEEAKQEAERCLNCPDRYCARHCPAHNYIPEFIAEIRAGNLERAWELLSYTNPLMEISGRVCPYECQCESHCTRGIKSEPVAIGRLERFVADWHRCNGTLRQNCAESNGKHVAVVGAGPADMTCALSLSNAGFQVTVYEKSSCTGGVTSWGIPSFVLPRHLISRLSDQMLAQGVELHLNTMLGRDISLEQLTKNNDAVFLATGAEQPVALDIPGANLPQVVQAKDYLSNASLYSGKNVLVIGSGNTAIDAARTALRYKPESVRIIYRRTEADMPATKEELALARAEGAQLVTLTSPIQFLAKDGQLCGAQCNVMELAPPDYPGGRNNVVPSGTHTMLQCDLVILALGFENLKVDGVASDQHNRILVNRDFATSMDKVYAGGDAITGAATLMKAVAAGKDAAAAIFSRLTTE